MQKSLNYAVKSCTLYYFELTLNINLVILYTIMGSNMQICAVHRDPKMTWQHDYIHLDLTEWDAVWDAWNEKTKQVT